MRKLFWLLFLAPWMAWAGGDEVVVIYNTRVPDSLAVAQHYAAVRQVPTNQILGFALSNNEDNNISRAEFTDSLQQPLVQQLVARGLWKFGSTEIAATPTQPAHTEERVIESKIRYAVLCYGIPLRIAASSEVEKIAEKVTNTQFRRNDASVDSELAWLPLIKMNLPLTGFFPNLLYGCTNHAMLSPLNGLLLVTRLDGPTKEIASALVDKAVEAEENGLWGRAYIDARGLTNNSAYYLGDQWMMNSAEICRQAGFETVTDTNEAVWTAAFPLSHIGIYAGWYTGVPSGPFAASKVEFMPGAFAYHLFSYSACSLRDTTNVWCAALLAKGVTCTMGCVNEPYLQFTPNVAGFLHDFCNGYTFGEAAWASQNVLSWQTSVIGDPLYQPFKKTPLELHAQLTTAQSPLLEWSFERLVNLDLARGARPPQLSTFVESIPRTATSAVLTEKLAELYDLQGKPASAINTWKQALKLHPSPQQRLRLRLTLGEKLTAQNRAAEAAEYYRQILTDIPDYPDAATLHEKIKTLEANVPKKL